MTRARRTDAELRALDVACRLCWANPRIWCRTVWTARPGSWATALHRERLADGASDGTLPIDLQPQRSDA